MSRIIRDFQLAGIEPPIIDAFDDSSIHSRWTVDQTNGTISEDSTKLSIANGGSVLIDWFGGTYNAPNVSIPITKRCDFNVKVYVENLYNEDTFGAGIAHYQDGDKSKNHIITLQNAGGNDYIWSYDGSGTSTVSLGRLYGECWLGIARRGNRIYILYSSQWFNDEPEFGEMTELWNFNTATGFNYGDDRIALFIRILASNYPALTAWFKRFRLEYVQ